MKLWKWTLLLATLLPPLASGQKAEVDEAFREIERLTGVIEIVRDQYVNEAKTAYPQLMASALRGMMRELDPYSQYIGPGQQASPEGNEHAVLAMAGFSFQPKAGKLVVTSVRENGPAAKAGLVQGDELIQVGKERIETTGYYDVLTLLNGNPGENLALTFRRPPSSEKQEISFAREVPSALNLRDAMLLAPQMTNGKKIGYVRLLEFGETATKELRDALDILEAKGMEGLVLDLRNNPGGLLREAVAVLSEFLPNATQVVTTEGRESKQVQPALKTTAPTKGPRKVPLVVLVNQSSASAAELVPSALQDLKRATIVGCQTFGKGSVQSIIPMGNGTAVRLTTALYYTPSHLKIHGSGVTPGVVAAVPIEEDRRLQQWRRDFPTKSSDPIAVMEQKDAVLIRGVKVLVEAVVKK